VPAKGSQVARGELESSCRRHAYIRALGLCSCIYDASGQDGPTRASEYCRRPFARAPRPYRSAFRARALLPVPRVVVPPLYARVLPAHGASASGPCPPSPPWLLRAYRIRSLPMAPTTSRPKCHEVLVNSSFQQAHPPPFAAAPCTSERSPRFTWPLHAPEPSAGASKQRMTCGRHKGPAHRHCPAAAQQNECGRFHQGPCRMRPTRPSRPRTARLLFPGRLRAGGDPLNLAAVRTKGLGWRRQGQLVKTAGQQPLIPA
jgi:hypothetical protein